jgi:hypothetical protein
MILTSFPGILSLSCYESLGLVIACTHPACGWGTIQSIDEWRSQVYLIEKSQLTEEIREELSILLPEDSVDPSLPLAKRAMLATHLVSVSEVLYAALVARGVRGWMFGYHRGNGLFRLFREGGGLPPMLYEQILFEATMTLPAGASFRPDCLAGLPYARDPDVLDWLLLCLSGGVLDMHSILLAVEISRRQTWGLLAPEEDRRSHFRFYQEVHSEQFRAMDLGAMHFDPGLQVPWGTRLSLGKEATEEPQRPSDELVACARMMASQDGPALVNAGLLGVFAREDFPALTFAKGTRDFQGEGWFGESEHMYHQEEYAEPMLTFLPAHRYIRTQSFDDA